MTKEIITNELLNKLLNTLTAETPFSGESISLETQEDGNFLLVSISLDQPSKAMPESAFKHVASLMNEIMPKRADDDSWMLVFTQHDTVVDSYAGGNLASPAVL